MSEPDGKVFVRGVVAWLLRLVAAYWLARLSAAGICTATDLSHWRYSTYVCGHNGAITFAPLFIVFWALLELGLPVLLKKARR